MTRCHEIYQGRQIKEVKMEKKNKKSKWFYRAKDELERIRKALKLAENQRNNLNQSVAELKTLERQFVYLIEDTKWQGDISIT